MSYRFLLPPYLPQTCCRCCGRNYWLANALETYCGCSVDAVRKCTLRLSYSDKQRVRIHHYFLWHLPIIDTTFESWNSLWAPASSTERLIRSPNDPGFCSSFTRLAMSSLMYLGCWAMMFAIRSGRSSPSSSLSIFFSSCVVGAPCYRNIWLANSMFLCIFIWLRGQCKCALPTWTQKVSFLIIAVIRNGTLMITWPAKRFCRSVSSFVKQHDFLVRFSIVVKY